MPWKTGGFVAFWKRVFNFFLFLSLAPAALAVGAALLKASRLRSLEEALMAFPSFTATSILGPVIASLVVSGAIGGLSLLAWPPNASNQLFRVFRTTLVICSVGFACYPSFGSTVPVVRGVPIFITAIVVLIFVAAVFVWPKNARITLREIGFLICVCYTFYNQGDGHVTRKKFIEIAGRELTAQDVVLLGFDSVAYQDVADILGTFAPAIGSRYVFENATTPMAVTNAAWRSILSGRYPEANVLPGDIWGSSDDGYGWLPSELREAGYSVTLVQDDPSTNVFARNEGISIETNQGWKWIMQTFMWRTLFPLSEVGGWWVERLPVPPQFASRHNYNPSLFHERVLYALARKVREGRVFYASHSCYAHTPIQLRFGEIINLQRWWCLSPQDFVGGASYFSSSESSNFQSVAKIRVKSVGDLIRSLLNDYERLGIIGKANFFLLSDHAQRASWIPRAAGHHIMLMACFPQYRQRLLYHGSVSLVDLTPTIRQILGMPSRASDGQSLLHAPAELGQRATRQMTPVSVLAGAKALLNPAELSFRRNVTYNSDGTFVLSEPLKAEIRNVIERESRSIKALEVIFSTADQRSLEETNNIDIKNIINLSK